MFARLSSSGALFLAVVGGFLPSLRAQSTNELLRRAEAALDAAAPRAAADPAHPIFHISAPAQWMNDPNGPIFYRGYYHLFYQLNPFSDGDGPKFWGHVRSRDLVRWERLPVALAPDADKGEAGIWSGCCTINGLGQPMIFYTSVSNGFSPQTCAAQCAALGDRDLITWQKYGNNPVLSESLHGGKKIYDWRDPFIFRDRHKTFLVTGGNLNQAGGGQAVVNIYEAENLALTQWKYRGVLFQIPDPAARTAECPNFFKVGRSWVLLVSPYGKVQYYIGSFDPVSCRFHPENHGLLDDGPNFYAPNTMQLADGRRIVWGWVTGFPGGHGWNGCLSLPRLLEVTRDGQLHQTPLPQLTRLRGRPVRATLSPGVAMALPQADALEIDATLALPSTAPVTLALANSDPGRQPIAMTLSHSTFRLADSESPLPSSESKGKMHVHMFIDHSVLEIFVNNTFCFTKTITPLGGHATLSLSSDDRIAEPSHIEAWPMRSIW